MEISKALREAGQLCTGRRWEKFLSQQHDGPGAGRAAGVARLRDRLELDFL